MTKYFIQNQINNDNNKQCYLFTSVHTAIVQRSGFAKKFRKRNYFLIFEMRVFTNNSLFI